MKIDQKFLNRLSLLLQQTIGYYFEEQNVIVFLIVF